MMSFSVFLQGITRTGSKAGVSIKLEGALAHDQEFSINHLRS
jgi:hypothetical protein